MISRNGTDYLSVGTACRLYNLSPPTMRKLVDANPNLMYRSVGGHRRISRTSLEMALGLRDEAHEIGQVICVMTRVSTPSQKSSLGNQEKACLEYCEKHLAGLPVEVNSSIRSGMNVGHDAFVKFILELCAGRYSHVVVAHSERICRSSLPLVRALCDRFNVSLIIINKIDASDADDFVSDLLAYTMYYNAKYNSSKSAKLTRIDVSDADIRRIYDRYREGCSYKDLADWCADNNITGMKGQRLSGAKIHKLLSNNNKLLRELRGAETDTARFIKSHIVPSTMWLKQTDIYDDYARYSRKNGVTPISAKKLGVALSQAGFVSGKALGGCKCWRVALRTSEGSGL